MKKCLSHVQLMEKELVVEMKLLKKVFMQVSGQTSRKQQTRITEDLVGDGLCQVKWEV